MESASRLRRRKTRTGRKKATSALVVAKQALRLAKSTASAATETKFLSYAQQADVINNGTGNFGGAAINRLLTTTAGTTALFNSDPITGNKAFLKGHKITWEIHMDSPNNEEETVNFTVAVVSLKKQADDMIQGGTTNEHISTIQGQTYYDPRLFKIHYYRHFTRTMGGTSPGTAGEMLRTGSCYLRVNKMIRWTQEGATGAQTNSYPLSFQDRLYFLVHTDNTAVDSGLLGLTIVSCPFTVTLMPILRSATRAGTPKLDLKVCPYNL